MAPIKRNADSDAAILKKGKHSNDDRAAKRSKTDSKLDVQKAKDHITAGAKVTEKKLPSRSVLKTEEKSFPRGGASVLTPLEHKQIQIQATEDVLFEQAGNKKPTHGSDSENEGQNGAKDVQKKSKKRKKGKAADAEAAAKEEPVDKIEGLSYKRLVPGSLVLGQVVRVTSRDITLALPNNLIGYVPVTAISNQLTKRVEKLLEADEKQEEDEEAEDFEDIDPTKIFKIGQYLRTYVTSNGSDDNKKRIELSLYPNLVNKGLSKSDVVVDSMIQASVVSVEDHGLVMDLGLEDSTIKGFMGSKELGNEWDADKIEEGAIFLCLVAGLNSSGSIVKLTADHEKAGNLKKPHFVKQAPTIDAFLPGTAAEILITDVSSFGIRAQIMGLLKVTADLIHSGGAQKLDELEKKYTIGSRHKARIIFSFPKGDTHQIGVSVLEHVLTLSSCTLANPQGISPLEQLPLSSIVEKVKVTKVESGKGLFLDVGVPHVHAFAHISRLSDKKVDMLYQDTGPYKLDSVHQARVVGYNPIDGLFLVSLEPKVLAQPFLRIADIKVGQIVKGTIEKLVVNEHGVGGVLVKIADGITGLVNEMHMADVKLQHPERKFKEGMKVTARILSANAEKGTIRMTLKKSLINSEIDPWTSYDIIKVGDQAPGMLINVLSTGAIVQFYGQVKAFLPVAEMSEAYIKDPREHFREGQVVNVHVLSIDRDPVKMRVSCKDPSIFGHLQQSAYEAAKIGSLVSGTITEISPETITLELKSGLKGIIKLMHLSDGSEKKCASVMKGLRVGQKLKDMLVLEKQEKQHAIKLTNKPSLIKDAANDNLLSSFDQVKEGVEVDGFVRNTSDAGIFVEFASGLTSLLPYSSMPESMKSLKGSGFGVKTGQSISATVLRVDPTPQRFILTLLDEQVAAHKAKATTTDIPPPADKNLINPADKTMTTIEDFNMGTRTAAKIVTLLSTQINVRLADNVHGRVHVGELFKSWDEIEDPKHPTKQFKKLDQKNMSVKIIGLHHARSQKFLAFSHRQAHHSVFDLSVRRLDQEGADPYALPNLKVGDEAVVFIMLHQVGSLLVSPASETTGVIDALDLGDGVDIPEEYPVGSAIRVRVKSIREEGKFLVRFEPLERANKPRLSFEDLKVGSFHNGKIAQITESFLRVRIGKEDGKTITGEVGLTELVDDYEQANPSDFIRRSVVRVQVAHVDEVKKFVYFTMRPSIVSPERKSSIKDRHISSYTDLKPKDVVRGFIVAISNSGLIVSVGPEVTALVLVAELSDKFVKDWKEGFEVGQLVKGKIVSCDPEARRMTMSLKESTVSNDNWHPEFQWNNLAEGQVVDGTVVKVFDYGVFVLVNNSRNIRGLCHRSEIADGKVKDVSKLYEEGDKVKAKIIKLENGRQKKINFSLKASHFADLVDDEDMSDEEGGVAIKVDADEDEDMEDGGVDLGDVKDMNDRESDAEGGAEVSDMDIDEPFIKSEPRVGLIAGAFDWSGNIERDDTGNASDASQAADSKKKKRRKAEIQIDKTGDLDKNGPQSIADFERQLLGEPNASALWIQYMAFQLGLSEVEKAREIAERALRTIHMREEDEKFNVWVAWLNLENAYGTTESLEEVFERACQHSDKKEMHQRLASIYIDSGKHKEAEDLFERMRKIKDLSTNPSYWQNYATFLMSTLIKPDAARALLPRATQALPAHERRPVISRFAALEFTSPNGDAERGRTVFEGLVETYKNRVDVWDMYLDLEVGVHGDREKGRRLFERMAGMKMKPRRAKYVFKRWLQFEEGFGGKKDVDAVKKRAAEYVEAHGQ
ncbi:nucleic acid-binding protein [Tothia fuscella]|uniref:rRNA biogenesis protein RRP5 n=1 Tax=Tothia fuscella TaxID=1048955 RepID=A0A9P4NKX3_9PEZI|nr:nucleic acid-binding protein [Tothia fuscella]